MGQFSTQVKPPAGFNHTWPRVPLLPPANVLLFQRGELCGGPRYFRVGTTIPTSPPTTEPNHCKLRTELNSVSSFGAPLAQFGVEICTITRKWHHAARVTGE
uniref:(northern house mosquito) hypothetical protein n=1 Tax=Culex pipiens TaxID=7175 RepID=A0A8D8BYN6_CULPI